ncbi:MAG TPA: hypothetical protein DDX98_11285 [Bacteroidales bacterium]|jgi:vacuolar-type H+-ATPase catalytic subunit A/Vma1|nr:hypothetical protein [Bacteroidales bacterium]
MRTATLKEIKEELKLLTQKQLIEICLRLAKQKKENKELLTYLLEYPAIEHVFIRSVKEEIDSNFSQINKSSFYYIKKSIRKNLSLTKKYIRYSKKPETEAELLLYFCEKFNSFKPSLKKSVSMRNLYDRQYHAILKAVSKLHEDLQYDYTEMLKEL